jgi:hypothetical protein
VLVGTIPTITRALEPKKHFDLREPTTVGPKELQLSGAARLNSNGSRESVKVAEATLDELVNPTAQNSRNVDRNTWMAGR